MFNILFQADGMFLTEIKMKGDPRNLRGYTIFEFREVLAEQLFLNIEDVRFEAAGSGCIILVFQLPERVRDRLRTAAKEKEQWLKEKGVLGIHIDGEEFILLVDNRNSKYGVVALDHVANQTSFACGTDLFESFLFKF